ncbi:MAG: hypothetical protein JXR83_05800 [Deltaproteobacteria bacterium]|nr:hypothetical protein [Deltaproteobacteria bacterium]
MWQGACAATCGSEVAGEDAGRDAATSDAAPDAFGVDRDTSDAVGGDAEAGADAGAPCGICILEPGDVVALRESRFETPEMGTPEYQAMAEACPVIVLDRILPPDPSSTFNHTIMITEGGTWEQARFIQATDPGGVFEADLSDWVLSPQTACGWQFLYAEVYQRPASYQVTARQAVANARAYAGESYAIVPGMLASTTWAHFRDDSDAELWDIVGLEGVTAALGLLGEVSWDFTVGGYTEDLYSQPRYCGRSSVGTEACGGLRRCNLCPPPGQGTKYCSELVWWAYGGFDGVNAAGDLPAGAEGQVPDLYRSTTSVMTATSHESNDLQRNFVTKCALAPFPELRLVGASCP